MLAKEICRLAPEVGLLDVSWGRFPDSFPNIFINGAADLSDADVSFLACFDRADAIFEQVSLMYALAALRPRSLKILLPYFPTGTMERIDTEGQVATASTLAQMLSAIAPAGPGPVPLYIWDIHALPIRHFFGPNIAPRFKSGIKLLREELAGRDVSIAFPDEGAKKRFKAMFTGISGEPDFPLIVCRKERIGDKRQVVVSEGEVAGRDVVIVDDLIHSGGTVIECLKALNAAGAKSVSAYATHGVFDCGSEAKFMEAGFARFYVTDSCPSASVLDGQGPFKVISLAGRMAKAILE